MVTAVERFGAPDGIALSVFHCPMAFDNRGASWLARKGPLLNPYFGAMMLRCGRVERGTVGAGLTPDEPTPDERTSDERTSGEPRR